MNDPLYTVEEVADFLRIGRTTVFALMRDGELPNVRIGRRTLIPESSIDAYVERLLAQQ